MDTNALKRFAQEARRSLIAQVSTQLDVVLAPGSEARRDHAKAVGTLEAKIRESDKGQVIEQAAYIWFNRFTALMYMDQCGYTGTRIVSPEGDDVRPAILSEALGGDFPDYLKSDDQNQIAALLDRTLPSQEPELEAYKLLLAAACSDWNSRMSFMFDDEESWSELLMPADLLAETSVLSTMREVMTEETCQDVEIIGWLYQFYISEKKDEVFAALKKNVKITAENIPAATQLFTPHWIVRYLVENSLGRLWLLNRPSSSLAEQMDYYIAPEEAETDYLKISGPEEIKICDPACGSGHMLTYAFDLLHGIYEEEGYDPATIPELILKHNLKGIEIDDRAGALASFALSMKAAARLGRRRFLAKLKSSDIEPNICVLENVTFSLDELSMVSSVIGQNLFTDELKETLYQFEQVKNFGSLIVPKLHDPAETLRVVEGRDFDGDLLLKEVQARVIAVLRMAEALSPNYHVVVANPPYMSKKGMNSQLQSFSRKQYQDTKSDLYAMFMERALALTSKEGMMAMINMQSWMFLSSYEKLRSNLLSNSTLLTMAHLGERAFDSIGGAVVSTTAFIYKKTLHLEYPGLYLRLVSGASEKEKSDMARFAIEHRVEPWFFASTGADFQRIPGQPICYWLSDRMIKLFENTSADQVSKLREGIHTGKNEAFIRNWNEVSADKIAYGCSSDFEVDQRGVWVPYNKGGSWRKWYGNNDLVVGFNAKIRNKMAVLSGHVRPSKSLYYKEGGTWSALASGKFGIRYYPKGFLFDSKGQVAVGGKFKELIALFNTNLFQALADTIMPTLDYKCGDVKKLPYLHEASLCLSAAARLICLSKSDWDAYETSWDFALLPLLSPDHRGETLEDSYDTLRAHWRSMTDEMKVLEEENNRIFIDAYGLQDELTPEVPLKEITLTCNPRYRYSRAKDWEDDDYEEALWTDTVKEFISYAVGCMMGRYSLDKPGLVLANQGETYEDYLAQVPSPTFDPDDDNVIPILEGENWFGDDITQRFRDFLRVTFGEEHFLENLEFIEEALGKDIRKYFLKDFYNDHVKRYKKRPIYWQFSSPKGYFNALIYMHRYNADTVSIILNDYLREFKTKLQNHKGSQQAITIDPASSDREKTKASKEIDNINKMLHDIEDYEDNILFPLAEERIEIDLDDGVKQNYPKFGKALKKVTGLSAK